MSETSAILHSATDRSLVLLDEIGRGTSTYDGVSIAWAVSEHLHDVSGCKTVFATHYHELTQLADQLPAVRNFNVRVREVGDQVLFLHTLDPGGADRSYGIEVGRLAGLPDAVLKRARVLLRQLEGGHLIASRRRAPTEQFALFDTTSTSTSAYVDAPDDRYAAADPLPAPTGGTATAATVPIVPTVEHPVVETLRTLDPNTMTPLQALETLARLVSDAQQTNVQP
jgi:DNA mismatch repair protein MutS